MTGRILSSVHLPESRDEGTGGIGNKFLPSTAGRSPVWLSPSQVPWDNRCEVLQVETNNSKDGSLFGWRLIQTAPCIKIASTKKKGWVIVMGDLLLKGAEGPIGWLDSLLGVVCCILGSWVKDVKNFYPDAVLRSLPINNFSGRQQWSPNKKSMLNQETSRPWDDWLRDWDKK